jgi:peptidoglycan biosynthesis protein MviN/MurJ (putative lipid II flippase)
LLAAVIVNLTINFFLIPAYGAKGSAIAAIISQYFCAFACYIAASKRFELTITIRNWITYSLTAIAMLLMLFLLQAIIHSVWIILAVLLVLLCIVIATQKKAFTTYVRSIIY